MAYKRNPMRAERISGLARWVMALPANTAQTAATQWLERTLDDSANRRLVLPEGFLATDAILVLATNIAAGLEVREEVIRRHVDEQMPFMATERWLMLGVASGGDRQALHERIRQHSLAVTAGGAVWSWGDNDYGQLGDGTRTRRLAPVRASGLSGASEVAGGRDYSVALVG
jgi:adenylosuccinate lyase